MRGSMQAPAAPRRTGARRELVYVALTVLTVLAGLGSSRAALIEDFDDLHYRGSGTKRSALVIGWNDGTSAHSLAWGYRWDGEATAADMLLAITQDDPNLFLRIDRDASWGMALFGIGYQAGDVAFGVTGAQDPAGNPVTPVFAAGIDDLDTAGGTIQAPESSVDTAPLNAVDYYREGWNDNGFWELYFIGSDNTVNEPSFLYPTDPSEWIDSWTGVSGAALVDEGWYALSFAPDFSSTKPGSAVAVIPEPASALFLLAGAGLVFLVRRRSAD